MLISAYHNLGVYDLMEKVVSLLPPEEGEPQVLPEGTMKLAIVGRTNVGKSMLMNSILGQERAIVSEVAGTTRDALDTIRNLWWPACGADRYSWNAGVAGKVGD